VIVSQRRILSRSFQPPDSRPIWKAAKALSSARRTPICSCGCRTLLYGRKDEKSATVRRIRSRGPLGSAGLLATSKFRRKAGELVRLVRRCGPSVRFIDLDGTGYLWTGRRLSSLWKTSLARKLSAVPPSGLCRGTDATPKFRRNLGRQSYWEQGRSMLQSSISMYLGEARWRLEYAKESENSTTAAITPRCCTRFEKGSNCAGRTIQLMLFVEMLIPP